MSIRIDTTTQRPDSEHAGRAWLTTCESSYRAFAAMDAGSGTELAELLERTRFEICEHDMEIPWTARTEWTMRLWLVRLAGKCNPGVCDLDDDPLRSRHLRVVLKCVGDYFYGLAKGIRLCCILHFCKNRWSWAFDGRPLPDYDEDPVPQTPEFCYVPCRQHRGAAKYPVVVLEDGR